MSIRDDNMVKKVSDLAYATHRIASAILPKNAAPGHDANGGYVSSLTEAVMGVSAGLHEIAHAIQSLADAVREQSE